MKIYRNGYVPDYERYLFFLNGRCIELHNIVGGKFHIYLARYRRKDIIKDSENFPVVGEISEKDIVELILSKVKRNGFKLPLLEKQGKNIDFKKLYIEEQQKKIKKLEGELIRVEATNRRFGND